ATLGIGESTSKTIVQCNVGKRSSVLLCALLPNKTESCHLDLEFEEPDDVMNSKLQQRFTLGRQSSGAPRNNAMLSSDASGGLEILMATLPHTWRCAKD
ncbi:peptidyl-prolyl cis-trans isomerase fkbp43, partial [Phtheirospermum japonicum]